MSQKAKLEKYAKKLSDLGNIKIETDKIAEFCELVNKMTSSGKDLFGKLIELSEFSIEFFLYTADIVLLNGEPSNPDLSYIICLNVYKAVKESNKKNVDVKGKEENYKIIEGYYNKWKDQDRFKPDKIKGSTDVFYSKVKENDDGALELFYVTLYKERPTSEITAKWMEKNGYDSKMMQNKYNQIIPSSDEDEIENGNDEE